MKKKIIGLLLLLTLVMPFSTLATEKKYTSLNLEDALEQEEIEHDLSNYKETDKQVTIYLFRGKGCTHCRNFLTFLNSIVDEYGQYFKLESYEVWYDKNNSDLMSKVAEFLESNSTGVPFIVIGDNVFNGYGDSYADAVKAAIMEQYNSKDKYDVMKEMEKAEKRAKFEEIKDVLIIVTFNFIFVGVATSIIIYVSKKHNLLLNNKLEELETKINSMEKAKEEVKEKKVVKKDNTKVNTKKSTKSKKEV